LTESPGEFAKFLLLWIASRAKLVVLNDDLRLRQSPTSERRGSDFQEALVVPELRILMERPHDPAPAILRNQMKSIQLVDACPDGPVPDALCGHPSRDLREAQRSFIVRDGFPEHGFYLVQRSEEGGGPWAFSVLGSFSSPHDTDVTIHTCTLRSCQRTGPEKYDNRLAAGACKARCAYWTRARRGLLSVL